MKENKFNIGDLVYHKSDSNSLGLVTGYYDVAEYYDVRWFRGYPLVQFKSKVQSHDKLNLTKVG